MAWVLIDVVVAVAGLAVLGALSVGVWRRVQGLTAEVGAAAARIAAARTGAEETRASSPAGG